MSSLKRQARMAGVLYLLVAIIAPMAMFYVPMTLIVRGNAAATASRILASEWLFRLGIAAHVIATIVFLFVVLALYRLLKSVHEGQAAAMLALVMVGVPVALVNELTYIGALMLFKGGEFLAVLDQPQREALGYALIRLHGQGSNLASIFWGLWLFPFGRLVMRSGFIPWPLGISLMLAGTGYVVSAFTTIALPQLSPMVDPIAMVLYFGELPIILWLLIWGARERRPALGTT